MKTPAQMMQFRPNLSLEENAVQYRSLDSSPPAYVQAAWIAVLGFAFYCLFDSLVTRPLGIPSYLVAAVVLSVPISVGVVLSESRGRSQKGFNAIETLVAANDAIIATINLVPEDKKRAACYHAYTLLLRSIYCIGMQRPFIVQLPDKNPEAHYEQLLQLLLFRLQEAGIDNIVSGANGRLHQVLQARSAIKMIVTVGISRSMYVAVTVLFVLSYVTIVLATARSIPWYYGAGFAATYAYGIGLLIFIAKNTSVPFGNRKSEIEMDERFQSIERKNLTAGFAATFFREEQAKTTA